MLVEQRLAAPWRMRFARQGRDEAIAARTHRNGPRSGASQLLEDPVTIRPRVAVRGPRTRTDLVEFSDFQCPYCLLAVAKLNAVLDAYRGRSSSSSTVSVRHALRLRWRGRRHRGHRQGKFWPMHELSSLTGANCPSHDAGPGPRRRTRYAALPADLDSAETRKTVARDMEDGDRAGVEGPLDIHQWPK